MTCERLISTLLIGTAMLIAGCHAAPDDAASDEEREGMRVEDTVFGDTVQTLDRAEAVEEQVLEEKRELDRAIDEAAGD